MNYKSLLDQQNLISFLKGIVAKDTNSTIITSAKEIIFHLQGNNNIPSKFYYNELYKKYNFQIKIINTNRGYVPQLYSLIGDKIKYIGQIYRDRNPVVTETITKKKVIVKPLPEPIPNEYLVDDLDIYIVSDDGEYLFIQNNTDYPPDPI